MRLIERVWYQNHPLKWLLLPLSALFAVITSVRRWLYRAGIKKQIKHPVPVIVVGNIGVGGNGKTPVVVHLCESLSQKGYKVGVISRGYGGKSEHYPLRLSETTPPAQAGDEPVLIKQRTGVEVVVSPNRNEAVEKLIALGAQVIISDDGLQHYKLGRTIELVVVDARRKFGNELLLPAGPLREPVSRLSEVDQVIMNVSASNAANIGEQSITESLIKASGKGVRGKGKVHEEINPVAMDLTADAFIHIKTGKRLSVADFIAQQSDKSEVIALAGIGDPSRYFATLSSIGVAPNKCLPFNDHHNYSEIEFNKLGVTSKSCVVMTEKDAVKCREFAGDNWWYLAVSAQFSAQHQAQLAQLLLSRLV